METFVDTVVWTALTFANFGSVRAPAMLDLWNTLVPLSFGRYVTRRVLHGSDSNHRITLDAAIIRRSACGPLNFSTFRRRGSHLNPG